MSEVCAAIDCGTNSTRLLISDGETDIVRRTQITKLGDGLAASGVLGAAAIERVLDTLGDYKQLLDEHNVGDVRIIATSAARDARNRDDFFDRVEHVVGTRPELLSGDDEALLTFTGATAGLDPAKGPYLVVDIGGGSTEFAFGSAACEAAISVDVGCVRMTETYIESDPPLPEELVACLSIIEQHLDDVVRLKPLIKTAMAAAPSPAMTSVSHATLIGVAGTVTTAAAIEQGLTTYDRDKVHHFELSKAAAEDVYRTMVTEDREDRAFNPGLEPDRVDTIVGGMCILIRIMRYFGFDSCLVSESDILDGVIATRKRDGGEA